MSIYRHRITLAPTLDDLRLHPIHRYWAWIGRCRHLRSLPYSRFRRERRVT